MSRDHSKWNYDVIMELLQGPLLNTKRLDEVIRATKFIRRIFSFLHPFNNRFSSILRTRVGLKSSALLTLSAQPQVGPPRVCSPQHHAGQPRGSKVPR